MFVNGISTTQASSNEWSKVISFGVEYAHRKTLDGGGLWLTRWGWSWREHLAPELWFADGAYTKQGTRLGYSTGHVYRLGVEAAKRKLDLVVKLSRMAQRVSSAGLIQSSPDLPTSFASPFEELGQLNELRASEAPRLYLFTKRPLGIFSPATRVPGWMHDRVAYEFARAARRTAADAAQWQGDGTVTLEADRDYYTLFEWVHGYNLQELVKLGRISHDELRAIDLEVRRRLSRLGFSVADHKPDHIIVRLDSHGAPRQRNGRWVVALADFELLESVEAPARLAANG